MNYKFIAGKWEHYFKPSCQEKFTVNLLIKLNTIFMVRKYEPTKAEWLSEFIAKYKINRVE